MIRTGSLQGRDIVQDAGWDERTTVTEAAERLGITKEAVRKRISRGTLRLEKDPDGTVRVYVPASDPPSGTAARDELVGALREEIGHLRRESERKDTIIMSLSQANAEQARTIREIEAPASPEAADAAETVEAEPERAEPRSAAEEAQEELGAERARRERAETTLHEGMAEERRRREDAEQERDDLRRELFAREGREEAHEEAEEQQGRGHQPRPDAPKPQTGAERRPWWRRVFGG